MNRKEWRILPILLIMVMIISAFGCSQKNDENKNYTYINENGEIEQYTFSGIPGDRPYIPSRDDVIHDRDKTEVSSSEQSGTEAPTTQNNTQPATTNPTEATTNEHTSEPTTEEPTTKELTWKEFQSLVKNILNGFKGTEEEAIKECEKALGRELTEKEKQAVRVIYKIIGNKPDITEPPLVP